MARQPLIHVVPNAHRLKFTFEPACVAKKSKLLALVGQCSVQWAVVESGLAVILGLLLNADSKAAVAVYQILRRSTAQREAINAAGKAVLESEEHLLLSAILAIHRSVEVERNALVHGHFGTCSKVQNGLLWMSTADFIGYGLDHHMDRPMAEMAKSIFVYKDSDLIALCGDIRKLWSHILNFSYYVTDKYVNSHAALGGLYIQLCEEPRIQQELASLRQKNASSR